MSGTPRPGRRRILTVAAGAGVLALGAAVAHRLGGFGSTSPASVPTGTGTGELSATGAARPALPVPQAVPADPYTPTPDVVIGTVSIPRLGLEAEVHEGITLTAIDQGPAHWPGTALPGGLGNVVVAGHRTTHTHPFAHLEQLQAGDQVTLTDATHPAVYAVRGW